MKTSYRDIAAAIGINVETLSHNFSRELTSGARIMRQWLLAIVIISAIEGNKGSAVLLERMAMENAKKRRPAEADTDRELSSFPHEAGRPSPYRNQVAHSSHRPIHKE